MLSGPLDVFLLDLASAFFVATVKILQSGLSILCIVGFVLDDRTVHMNAACTCTIISSAMRLSLGISMGTLSNECGVSYGFASIADYSV